MAGWARENGELGIAMTAVLCNYTRGRWQERFLPLLVFGLRGAHSLSASPRLYKRAQCSSQILHDVFVAKHMIHRLQLYSDCEMSAITGRLPAGRRRQRQRRPIGAAGTSLDALGAKVACEKLGYFKDPFVHEFGVKYSRKSPIIHRGA